MCVLSALCFCFRGRTCSLLGATISVCMSTCVCVSADSHFCFSFFFSARNSLFFFFTKKKKKKQQRQKTKKQRGKKNNTTYIYSSSVFAEENPHLSKLCVALLATHKAKQGGKKKKTHNLHLFYPTARTGRSTIVFFFPHFDTSTRKSFRLFFFFFFCVYLIKKKKEREEKNKRQKEKRQ